MTEFHTRVVVFDTIREFDKPDYDIVDSLELLEEKLLQDSFRIRVWHDLDNETFFDDVCELIFQHSDLLFIIDEVDQHTGATYCPTGFRKIINYGRHQSIEIICTSRSPAEIPKMLIGQTTDIYFFRITEPNHLRYLAGIYDRDIDEIKALPNHKHIHFET